MSIDENLSREETAAPSMGAKLFGILSEVLFYLMLVAIIVAAVTFASSRSESKSILGYRYYDVLTGSMEPTYSVGDLIFVKVSSADEVQVGDVITFNPGSTSDSYLTHRVVEKHDNYQGSGVTCFTTKGDANETDDPFIIDESRIVGVVTFSIPFLGYIILFAQTYYIFIIAFIVLFTVFFTLLEKLSEVSAEIQALENEETEGENSEISDDDTAVSS